VLEIRPVTGIGEVTPRTDLAAEIMAAAPWIEDGDVLVVTSKIVSKAEGRLVPVPEEDGPRREAARTAALAAETARVVARRGPTRIVQTHHGFVMAAAGIDASNVARDRLVLLPVDPDASARALRAALRERHGRRVAVVITDTMGRPWRIGLTDVAIGVAGIAALRDYRGERDGYGNELAVTEMAVADELAGAGELVKGKYDQVPVAVVRGVPGVLDDDGAGARVMVRPADLDMFSLGTAEARALGRSDAATLPEAAGFTGDPVDRDLVEAAVRAIDATPGDATDTGAAAGRGTDAAPGDVTDTGAEPAAFVHPTDAGAADKLRDLAPVGTADVVVPTVPAGVDAWGAARVGERVHRLRAALAAEGLATAWITPDPAAITQLVALPPGVEPLGLLAIGI
jgi:coenzyme F420-0:L-glutamate ligase/coenzyme F420-1:gamma-L-glutamate ligase